MKFYDIRCKKCGVIERDVIASTSKKAEKKCDCGGRMKWHPSFGSVDARSPWYCVQTDRKFSSYREMEKWCDKNGKTVVSQRDYDQSVRGRSTDYEKVVAKNDAFRREAVQRAAYRLKHKYRDHPEIV